MNATADSDLFDEPLKWITPEQMAVVLGVSARTVRRWVQEGLLPAFRQGRTIRILPSDAERFIEENSSRNGSGQ